MISIILVLSTISAASAQYGTFPMSAMNPYGQAQMAGAGQYPMMGQMGVPMSNMQQGGAAMPMYGPYGTLNGANMADLQRGLAPQIAQFGNRGGQMGQFGQQLTPQQMGQMAQQQQYGQYGQYGANGMNGAGAGQQFGNAATGPVLQPLPSGYGQSNWQPFGQYGQGAQAMGAQTGQFGPSNVGPLSPMTSSFGQFQDDSRAASSSSSNTVANAQPTPTTAQATRIVPSFLKEASQQQQDQFYAIVQHPMWSPQDKQQKIDELIRTFDNKIQSSYTDFQTTASKNFDAKRQKVHQAVEDMTPEAQLYFQKVSALMTNPGLSQNERLQKIEDLYKRIPDSVKKEFDNRLQGF